MNPIPVSELADAPSLARLHPGACSALRRLYEDAPAFALSAGPLQGTLRFVFDAREPARIAPEGLVRFRLGTHSGTLALDLPGLAALCAEPRIDLLPAELRTILLADALHAPMQSLQVVTRARFEWLAGQAANGLPAHAAGFVFEDAQSVLLARGQVGFDDPAALEALVPAFERAPRRPNLAVLRRLRMPLHFEIGSTSIRWLELRGIGRGDIVGIERWRPAGAGIHVSAWLGGLQFAAVSEGTRLILHSIGDTMTTPPPLDAARASADDSGNLPLERLDALEVSLRFELGALDLSLGELRALKPGHVFDLAQPLNRSAVRIVAHGNVLGKGHLVAIGDRLGVRVAEFAAGSL
jgi:type III secretion protein Q